MLQNFRYEQNLLTNSIWTYTITNLRVNQWKIFAADIQIDLLDICPFTDFAHWKTN